MAVADTNLSLLKDHFWHLQIKMKFQKKIKRQGSVWLQDADFFWIIPCLSKTIIISDMIDFMKAKSCCETTHASTKQRLAVIYASFLLLKQEKCYRSTQNLIFFSIFCVFHRKYLPWVIECQENQLFILIYIIKPHTIMPVL